MGIWTYQEENDEFPPVRSIAGVFDLRGTATCIFCDTRMKVLRGEPLSGYVSKGMNLKSRVIYGCPLCGWWSIYNIDAAAPFETYDGGYAFLRHSSGILRKLDIADISIPTQELRNYLVGRYDERFQIHPKKYEDIVGGVFSDFGFNVRITSYSDDGGVDIFILDSNDGKVVGIQVKRYKGKITAENIRELVGALVVHELTCGIYVTTNSYTKGAERTAQAAQTRSGIAIKFMDARNFYDALRITTRAEHWDPSDPSAPYFECWRNIEKAPVIWGSSW